MRGPTCVIAGAKIIIKGQLQTNFREERAAKQLLPLFQGLRVAPVINLLGQGYFKARGRTLLSFVQVSQLVSMEFHPGRRLRPAVLLS